MTRPHRIMIGDCIDMMRTLPDQSVQCCITSPPYFGLRDYGVDGQIDAQRLRADTAEAERDSLRTSKEAIEVNLSKVDNGLLEAMLEIETKEQEISLSDQYAKYQDERVTAAERRIAELTEILSSAVEWFDDGVGRSHEEFRVVQKMRAALNPSPEAESHE